MKTNGVNNQSGSMAHIDVEFEHAVRAVIKQLRDLESDPDSEKRQRALSRALWSARLLYCDVLRKYGDKYGAGADLLCSQVRKVPVILPQRKNSPQIVKSIHRQAKEIERVCKSCRRLAAG